VLCGSTVEHVGYEKAVTAKGLVDILSTACSAVPSLGSATLSGTASNFRPLVRDADGPLVGASNLAGLHLATGHYRNGILLANETASAVVTAVLGH
jgi:glycine oxidase